MRAIETLRAILDGRPTSGIQWKPNPIERAMAELLIEIAERIENVQQGYGQEEESGGPTSVEN